MREVARCIEAISRSPDSVERLNLCRSAMQLITAFEFPELYCRLSLLFAMAVVQDRSSDPSRTVDEAIRALQTCRRLKPQYRDDRLIAEVHERLGDLYRLRPTGDCQRNARRAIQYYRRAMAIHSIVPSPHLANLYHSIGVLHIQCCQPDAALGCLLTALDFLDPVGGMTLWATVHSDIALAFLLRDTREAVESAIQHLEMALRVFNQEETPELCAHAHRRLGLAYRSSSVRHLPAHVDSAIKHFQLAQSIFGTRNDRVVWASVCQELGRTYAQRDELSNNGIRAAVGWLQKARVVFESVGDLRECAAIERDIARTYSKTNHPVLPDLLAAADDYYARAIRSYSALGDSARVERLHRMRWLNSRRMAGNGWPENGGL